MFVGIFKNSVYQGHIPNKADLKASSDGMLHKVIDNVEVCFQHIVDWQDMHIENIGA